MKFLQIAALLGSWLGVGTAILAQAPVEVTPKLVNAKIETRAVIGALAAELRSIVARQAAPEWIGYAVAQVAGERTMCCGDYSEGSRWNCGTCRLEGRENGTNMRTEEDKKVKLEGPRNVLVLFRAEKSAVGKIRVISEECELDAGGLTVVWLTSVKPAESVTLLETFALEGYKESREERRMGDAALMAIALQEGQAADRALTSFTAPDKPEKLREQTAFWLGATRGAAGMPLLVKMAESDPSPDVRGQVAFGLSVSKGPGAVEEMIRMAKSDESGHVRGQALFWLAQKAGNKATGAISAAIEDDPDTDVKKKAVFALSQLPKDEGVPRLIEVARTNRNREVRKQAMFWLGQSEDPRALKFFEEILLN